jgi:hypothetical protein
MLEYGEAYLEENARIVAEMIDAMTPEAVAFARQLANDVADEELEAA